MVVAADEEQRKMCKKKRTRKITTLLVKRKGKATDDDDQNASFEQDIPPPPPPPPPLPIPPSSSVLSPLPPFGRKQQESDFSREAIEFGFLVQEKLLTATRRMEKTKQQSINAGSKRSLGDSTELARATFTQAVLAEFNLPFYKNELSYLEDLFDVDLPSLRPPASLVNSKTRESVLTSFAHQLFEKLSSRAPSTLTETLSLLFV